MFEVALKNNNKPDLGAVTVEFPIPEDQYAETIRALERIEIGAILDEDCRVQTSVRQTPLLCAG